MVRIKRLPLVYGLDGLLVTEDVRTSLLDTISRNATQA